ncbi:Uncharacterized family 31 glucosidase KIAA1161 [Camponotus floridanus]|uniref:Uncharacterized family 31 glucosidase KIAA1161 n=1 Tax=Camponotus floridanus TaxID=104421 RepID=E2A1Y6_CAMFO|nr:Uncharacterized family 31 glucosidase KIAA1161 [Camponotus floridanus]
MLRIPELVLMQIARSSTLLAWQLIPLPSLSIVIHLSRVPNGGPEYRYQYWPIQHMYYDKEPYLPTHPTNMALSERYWLSSKGISIYVNETSPLFLDQNNYLDNHLCLIAKNKAPYRHRDSIQLNYELGVFLDPKTAHQNMVKTHLGKPTGHPDERMIQHPIWSTWARYKANITDKIVETYADEIIANKFYNSQIEIDDKWETCYGSAVFDPIKFPNVTALVQRLKQKGFRVTLWIHPFINRDCEPAYSTALQNSFFVKDLNRRVQMSWWQELFIRWLQANVFMPSLQYSFVPWDYDKETIAICKKYTDLHANMTPEILNAMQQAITKGTPVNPPIWWIDPTDEEAYKINDEYLLGETILAAPVTQEGFTRRDIYLPIGTWFDPNKGTIINGPTWLRDYDAPLDILPYFIKKKHY